MKKTLTVNMKFLLKDGIANSRTIFIFRQEMQSIKVECTIKNIGNNKLTY